MSPTHEVCIVCQKLDSKPTCPRCEGPCEYTLGTGKPTCINQDCANLCYRCNEPTYKGGGRTRGRTRTDKGYCAAGCPANSVYVHYHNVCASNLSHCVFCSHLTWFTLDKDSKVHCCPLCIAEHSKLMRPFDEFTNKSESDMREQISTYHRELYKLISSFDTAMSVEDMQIQIYNFKVEYGKNSDEEKRLAHLYERRRKSDKAIRSHAESSVQGEERAE
jgi:hypothetical protein